ncbi:hypothetical protein ACLGIH_08785 [Streptomyces sp. HMX87]|uniref:WXG100 family type VII secretion target n=1 Tax=Streptomyces sp. HMX87 TaxID=3390849 RepID=UPI003A879A82
MDERLDAQAQNGTLDAVMQMTRIVSPFGSARGIHFARTNFEGYDLNDMVDIVESANPELLESAGKAMIDAREAIGKAAQELKDNLPSVDWEGEAHTAFDNWAKSLVKTAEGIGDYADIIGTQVMAAGSGLASVRKSMPPRDTRSERKTVEDIPEAKRTESNDEYTAAVKAEKNRQEAINQMYRLASFYTVSAGQMKKAEEPVFPKMPDVGVPKPSGNSYNHAPPGPGAGPLAALGDVRATYQEPVVTESARSRTEDPQSLLKAKPEPEASSRPPVGTEINTVGTLPNQEAVKPISVAPPSTTGPTAAIGPVPPAPPAVPPTARGLTGRAAGPNGVPVNRIPPSAQGRATGATGHGPAARSGAGPIAQGSRTTAPGPVGSRGTGPGSLGPVGRAATPGQAGGRVTGPVGRGIVGGVPNPAGPAAGRSSAALRGPMGPMGATPPARGSSGGAASGVVGGRPVTGSAAGNRDSKVPRGTVIGGEGTPAEQSGKGRRVDQRGVIGGPSAPTTSGQSPRGSSVPSSGSVIGTRRGGVPGGKGNGSSSGVVRRPASDHASDGERSRRGDQRDGTPASD